MHYKLDRGIDHVLIDEAQDTSPRQWEIIRALTAEFFAGAGARAVNRTIFAVGDEKQSIFSFQGAAPREFDAMRRSSQAHCRAIERHLQYVRVPALVPLRTERAGRSGHSVRAAGSIQRALRRATCSRCTNCVAGRGARPGRDLGYAQARGKARDRGLGRAVRRIDRNQPAGAAGAEDRQATSSAGSSNGARAGDVLVLVRQRGPLFEAIIRALKDAAHPGRRRRPAGADRAYRGHGPDGAGGRAAAAR